MTTKILVGICAMLCMFSYKAEAASTATCYDTSDTVLMLHMDGADASTTFTDSDDGAKTVTVGGNVQIDTAQSKFGGASGLFDGTGDYIQIASHADFALAGDFTIDYWVRFNSFASEQQQYIWGTSATTNNAFSIHSTGGGRFDIFVGTTAGNFVSFTISNSTWYHVAVTRSSSTAKLFVDGVQKDSWTASNAITQDSVIFGTYSDFSSRALNGWIDELRIVKGTAVWTSGFTPPSSAYTSCSTRKRLILMS